MIRHTILFKVKSTVADAEIDNALAAMKELETVLPDVFSVDTGECQFHDDKSKFFFTYKMLQGVTHAVSIDFMNENALEDFFVNPATKIAKELVVRIAENGYKGIIGFDLESQEI
tara:strand:- start:3504 stop:3848 length:345 start_codon:yes stop_codon:yes gene_type:complete